MHHNDYKFRLFWTVIVLIVPYAYHNVDSGTNVGSRQFCNGI